ASFAGQQATFLDVQGENEVIKAVRKCWASLYTPRAIFYRVQQGFDHSKVGIAVVVQQMVKSEVAGVMFTAEPTGDTTKIIIEAAYGLGEAVVSGSVNPDTYVVDKETMKILKKSIRKQDFKIVRNEKALGTTVIELDEKTGRNQKLSDEKIIELAGIGKRIEEHYGKPQDIEWALEEGRLYIVQSRAITTLSMKKEVTEEVTGEVIAKGMPASPGVATGTVKVVHSIDELDKVEQGDILTTKMTNPDMVPAMRKAAAIVTDEGGLTCFTGKTQIITNRGIMPLAEVYERMEAGERLYTLSVNQKTMKTEWKKIDAAMKRKAPVIRVRLSQTGKARGNTLELTPDHRMIILENRRLIKKEISHILDDAQALCTIDYIPPLSESSEKNRKLAYLMGAVFTDGNISLRGTKGQVSFIQKDCPDKKEFIDCVNTYFNEVFDSPLTSTDHSYTSTIRGYTFTSNATRLYCAQKQPALMLNSMYEQLESWVLTTDEESLCMFLAGVADGDGSFHHGHGCRLHIYSGDSNLTKAIVLSCLRLGIQPTLYRNRENCTNIQIVEGIDKILKYTKRIKADVRTKHQGTKYFAAKQVLEDIIDDVNWKGKIKPYVQKNLLIDSEKIRNKVIPMAPEKEKTELNKIIDSDLRMKRVAYDSELGIQEVYNIEVRDNHNYIVLTEQLTPVLVANCHAAIVSRELGVPCVVGTEKITQIVNDGDVITVDATKGIVYRGKKEIEEVKEEVGPVPETKTKVYLNLGVPEKAEEYAKLPVDGVGLMREEFIIATYIKEHPLKLIKEGRQQVFIDKLAEGVAKVARAFAPRPVVLRLSDFKTNEYRKLIGGEEFEPIEDNPMIGWRGCSRYYHEDYKEAFKLELKAVKKVREEMNLKNLWIMLPFIRTIDEAEKVEAIMKEEGLERSEDFKLWFMAEVPSTAFLAEEFAKHCDGFSIGTNDLTQLVLGVDRDSERLGRMGLFDERNEAVKKAVKMIVDGAHAQGRTVSLCGQAPSNYPEFAEFLVSIGIDSISVNHDVVYKTKRVVAEAEKRLKQQGGEEKKQKKIHFELFGFKI
ncbi:MAG: phosphoenolpyruvate synthase, partial [Candidatus Diapherotrites archaeon]|nr:phosphoenolpyruvate synthase [Candidatus Diapherotrites archaeon]